ncbi:MAG: PqqD family peptide modification chaperone [Blastocatellia bacterium]
MKINDEAILPAARTEDLIVQEMADEVLVYDQRRHQAHCLNETAARVWRGLDGQSTAHQIAARLSRQQGVEVSAAVVELAVDQLQRSGLLNGALAANPASGVSRRAMLKRVGIGAAVALPVVASIVAPRAAQAATCGGAGSACSTSSQCCSGVCSNGTCA